MRDDGGLGGLTSGLSAGLGLGLHSRPLGLDGNGGGSPLSENIDALSEEILSEVAELKQWVRSHRVAMGSGATTISPASLAAMS